MRMLLPAIVVLMALACTSEEQLLVVTGTSWTLTSIAGSQAIGDVEVEFSDEWGISGWTGCNSYRGKYSVSGASFTIEELESTERGCPTQELFMQEQTFLNLLNRAVGFDVDDSELTITSSNNQTLVFALR